MNRPDFTPMRSIGWIALIAVIVVVFAFFVPVFPTQTSSDYFGVVQAQVTADVSLTFLASHCGSYINAQYTATYLGVQTTHPLSKGYNFSCDVQVTSSS